MKKLILLFAICASITSFAQGGTIPLDSAAVMTARFRSAYPAINIGESFANSEVDAVQTQTDCVKLKIYFGLDYNGVLKVILVGVKTVSGVDKDMYTLVLKERGACCLPGAGCGICAGSANSNPLNTNQ